MVVPISPSGKGPLFCGEEAGTGGLTGLQSAGLQPGGAKAGLPRARTPARAGLETLPEPAD